MHGLNPVLVAGCVDFSTIRMPTKLIVLISVGNRVFILYGGDVSTN